jgi:hypothetical protein
MRDKTRLIALVRERDWTIERFEKFHMTTRRYNRKTAIFVLTAVRTSNQT